MSDTPYKQKKPNKHMTQVLLCIKDKRKVGVLDHVPSMDVEFNKRNNTFLKALCFYIQLYSFLVLTLFLLWFWTLPVLV